MKRYFTDILQQKPPRNIAKPLIIGLLAILGIGIGLASSRLPVLITFLVLGGITLFAIIYRNLYLGVLLFVIVNLILPQAGPTWNVGMQTPVGERGIHFNVHEIIMTMVLLSWLIQAFLKKIDWKKKSPMMIPIALYVITSIIACFIGILHGAKPLVPIFRFTRTVFFAYIFFIFLTTINNRKQFNRIIVIVLICVTLVAGFGLVQKVMGEGWSEKVSVKILDKLGYPKEINYVAGSAEGQAYRINSTFAHPNLLGGYLVIFLPLFISLLWYYPEYWQKILLLLGLALIVACLFFTGSRAAWIAAAVIAVIYGILGVRDKRMVLGIFTIILLVLVVLVLIKPPDFVTKRFASSSAQESNRIRMYQYRIAFDYIMEEPLFGIGMGMEGKQIRASYIMEMWVAVENLYLTYMVSHGAVGFIPFMLLFIVYWWMLLLVRARSKGDPFLRYHSEAFVLGILGLAIANLFGAWLLFAIPMVTIWWMVLGLGGVLYKFYQEEGPVPVPKLLPAVT